MVYQWKISQPVPAQIAGEEMEKIIQRDGQVTPESLLAESRDEGAPLHPCFEWDDAKAAESYRIVQARALIRNITVIVDTPQKQGETVRAFVNISREQKGAFVSIQSAIANNEQWERVMELAIMELQAFQKKYSVYAQMTDIVNDIEEVVKKYKKVA